MRNASLAVCGTRRANPSSPQTHAAASPRTHFQHFYKHGVLKKRKKERKIESLLKFKPEGPESFLNRDGGEKEKKKQDGPVWLEHGCNLIPNKHDMSCERLKEKGEEKKKRRFDPSDPNWLQPAWKHGSQGQKKKKKVSERGRALLSEANKSTLYASFSFFLRWGREAKKRGTDPDALNRAPAWNLPTFEVRAGKCIYLLRVRRRRRWWMTRPAESRGRSGESRRH